MSTITVDTVKSSVAGVAPAIRDINGVELSQGCTAWVNFNGTGVVAIRNSFNVSSITDNGVGDYTVNFANAMNNAAYSGAGTARKAVSQFSIVNEVSVMTTSSYRFTVFGWTSGNIGAPFDSDTVLVTIMGGK